MVCSRLCTKIQQMPSAFLLLLLAALAKACGGLSQATQTRFRPQGSNSGADPNSSALMLPGWVHSQGSCTVTCHLFVLIYPLSPALLMLQGRLVPRSQTFTWESNKSAPWPSHCNQKVWEAMAREVAEQDGCHQPRYFCQGQQVGSLKSAVKVAFVEIFHAWVHHRHLSIWTGIRQIDTL